MPQFEVPILKIDRVEDHPHADRLSINHLRGYRVISNKQEDGTHRYTPGQLVAYVPIHTILPESILRSYGYWDEETNKGLLGGPRNDIVKPILLRKLPSEGIILPTTVFNGASYMKNGIGDLRLVQEGSDVSSFIGAWHYRPVYFQTLPTEKLGVEMYAFLKLDYEVEDLKKYPAALDSVPCIMTEMLNGLGCTIGYDRRLEAGGNHPFFVAVGLYVITGDNVYTKIAAPIFEKIKKYLIEMPAIDRFYIFGDIIGTQDMKYGLVEPEFRATDIQMGLMGGGKDSIPFGFLDFEKKMQLLAWLDIPNAPILGTGKSSFDEYLGIANQRASDIHGNFMKGIVITPIKEKIVGGRRQIYRLLSDNFLIRKNGSDYK